jgi:hypothetical protein
VSRAGPHPRRYPLRQRGFALASLLAAVLAFTLLLVTAWTQAAARRAEAVAAADQRLQLAAARVQLSDWYLRHLADLDAPGLLPPQPEVHTGTRGAQLQVEVGALQFDHEVPGRAVTAWFASAAAPAHRPAAAPGGPDLSADPGILQARVDGWTLERAALAQARRQLQGLAARLEIWFQARVADDPLHRLDRNHFRPRDPACLALDGELPCLPDYTPVERHAAWRSALAIGAEELRSPWGDCCPVEASTGADASQQAPFSVALRIRTPWGQLLQAQAVEPGG